MPLPSDPVSRRMILKRSAGFFGFVMGGLLTHNSLATLLTKPTPRQSLGPFFPDDGDEVDAIRENPAPSLPISRANDQDLTFVKGRKGKAQGQVIFLRGRVLDAKSGQPIPNTILIMWSGVCTGKRMGRCGDVHCRSVLFDSKFLRHSSLRWNSAPQFKPPLGRQKIRATG